MQKMLTILIGSAVVLYGVGLLASYVSTASKTPTPAPTQAYTKPALVSPPPPEATPTPTPSPTPESAVVAPIADFKARITKKLFGTHVTPTDSPVQPERFTGYHTGVDVEYGDVTDDVPIYAIADGRVVRSGFVSGYGGLVAIEHTVNGEHFFSLYGHLRPSSLPRVGTTVTKGQGIGVLGTAYSTETDGERRHLHFAIVVKNTLDVRGYTSSTDELHSIWKDPLTLYP